MFVQILIYVYLGICAGMILFNIATALLSQRREHRFFRDGICLELTVSQELDRLAETGAVSERHLRFMERRLRRVNGMAAFDAALERLCVRRPELTRSYLTALNGVTITPSRSTTTGCTNPNCRMLSATLATWRASCFFALAA